MNTRLAIKPPSKKTAPAIVTKPPAVILAELEPELARAFSLAKAARAAAAAGDHAKAAGLRAEHDAIFAELDKRLPKI